MKKIMILFVCATALVAMSFTTISNDFNFKVLEGDNWTGSLTYLNYTDNASKATIPCKMNGVFKKGKLMTIIPFDEAKKNGKQIIHNYDYEIKNNQIKSGKWNIIEQRKEGDKTIIVAMSKGKDNNKLADFRLTLTMSENFFSRQKETRYNGTDTFFTRHTYTFTR